VAEALLGWAGTVLTEKLLTWAVLEAGQPLDLPLKQRVFRPDVVTETDENAGLRLTAAAAWPARNVLAIRFTLENLTAAARDLTVSFDYPAKGTPADWEGALQAGQPVSIEDEPEGSWSTLFTHREHGRNFIWVSEFVAGMPETTLEAVCLADLADKAVTLAPGGSAEFTVSLAFGLSRGRARAAQQEWQQAAAAWSPETETARVREILNSAPPLPEKYAGEAYQRLYAHAITSLNSLYIRGEGGYTGERSIPWTTKHILAIAFFWDTAFSCVGAREFAPHLAQEAISCFADNLSPRGAMPGTMSDTHRAGEGQSPIMTWAAWTAYQSSGDKAWLAQVYPALVSQLRFWFKYHSSARGLAQYYNAGQIADDSPRFDPVYGRPQGNEWIFGLESPDINAFIVHELKHLAAIARVLDKPDDAAMWQTEAAALGQLIIDTMYFPEDALFYDVKLGTKEPFTRVKTPNMFLPLWAGVPLPEAEIKRIIEGHMLNPAEFFGEKPFPSTSYDDPAYDPNGYWRGRVWPHFVYWIIQTLWRYGYHAEAEHTADRIIEMFQTTPWLHENYNSGSGSGWDADRKIGFPDYNWSCATVIELLLERYKEPLP
jgi:glycogen debranching enzyme